MNVLNDKVIVISINVLKIASGGIMPKLIMILGDQLSEDISSLRNLSAEDTVLMMEIRSETDRIKHHRRKILFLFSAMRHFAVQLSEKCNVKYIKLNDPDNRHDFLENLALVIGRGQFDRVLMTEPAEYGLLQYFEEGMKKLKLQFELMEDDRFFVSKEEFREYSEQSNSLMMENFYRKIRKKTGYLMQNGKPVGGKWNYDHDNRGKYDGVTEIPCRPFFPPDSITSEVVETVIPTFNSTAKIKFSQ